MTEKMFCAVCNKEMDALNYNAWRCDKCNKFFCGNHIDILNHNCEKIPQEKITKGKIERKKIALSGVGVLFLWYTINSIKDTSLPVTLTFAIISLMCFVLAFVKIEFKGKK